MSDPTDPSSLAVFEVVGSNSDGVAVDESTAYVAGGSAGLHVFDLGS